MTDGQGGLRGFTTYSGNVKEKLTELSLGELTAILGEEATYKSTIAIGVRLALTGAYEPVGKNPSDLISLAADPLVGIEAVLSGPDGTASWRLKVDPETAKPKKPESPHFEGRLNTLSDEERRRIIPTDSVRDLLKNARGDRKLREAFIGRFGGSLRDIPEPVAMDDEERIIWAEAIEEGKKKLDQDASADTLLAWLSEHFRKESGARRREITPIENFVKQKKAALSQLEVQDGLTPELLGETEAKLMRARAWEQAEGDRGVKKGAEDDLAQVQEAIAAAELAAQAKEQEFDARVARFQEALVNAEATKNKALAALLSASNGVAAWETLSAAYARQIANGGTKCQLCPHDFGAIEPMIATKDLLDRKAEGRREAEKKAQAAYEQCERALDSAKQALVEHEKAKQNCIWASQLLHDQIRRRYADASVALRDAEKRLASAPTKYTGPKADELQKQVDTLKAAAEARTALVREGAKLRKMEKVYEVLKKLEGEAVEIQKQVMGRVAKRASEEVSQGMLDGRRARLDPHTCEWYVVRKDGKEFGPFGALCGTEKTSLLLGLVAAWTRGSPLRVAIFDDEDMVGLSAKGIQDFRDQCKALKERGDFTQVLLVSNRPELWLDQEGKQKAECAGWLLILREPRARTPDEAAV